MFFKYIEKKLILTTIHWFLLLNFFGRFSTQFCTIISNSSGCKKIHIISLKVSKLKLHLWKRLKEFVVLNRTLWSWWCWKIRLWKLVEKIDIKVIYKIIWLEIAKKNHKFVHSTLFSTCHYFVIVLLKNNQKTLGVNLVSFCIVVLIEVRA